MSFNPAVPLNSDSPSIFPAQNQINMTRLQTLLGEDHQFNLTATVNSDGYHKIIHMTQQAPTGVAAAIGRLYAKTSGGRVHAFYMDDQGTEYQISPSLAIRAAVAFDSAGAPISAYNVSGVTVNGSNIYTITFAIPMPDTNYIVTVTGMAASGTSRNGMLVSPRASTVSVGSVQVVFKNTSSSNELVDCGNVVVYSII